MNERKPSKRPRRRLPQIAIRLPEDQIADLERLVEQTHGRYNRSDLIRQAIDEYLKRQKNQ